MNNGGFIHSKNLRQVRQRLRLHQWLSLGGVLGVLGVGVEARTLAGVRGMAGGQGPGRARRLGRTRWVRGRAAVVIRNVLVLVLAQVRAMEAGRSCGRAWTRRRWRSREARAETRKPRADGGSRGHSGSSRASSRRRGRRGSIRGPRRRSLCCLR